MVFCNMVLHTIRGDGGKCHNPYFNRWFSAIEMTIISYQQENVTILILIDGFLQSE